MLSINTNTSSLIVQNSMKSSTNKLNQAIERMTTGTKINHAKDNAANYSIATNMTTKINALQVAEDNTSLGLNMTATASESLFTISKWGQYLRNLAIQANNGTYSTSSLDALNNEATQLINEIYREKSSCSYNGIALWGNEVNFHNEAMDLKVNSQGFLQEVNVRDTSTMTKMSSVDETTAISNGTYSISSAEELAKLATMANNDLILGGEFVLAADIDLSGYRSGGGWVSIGNTTNGFSANFDGNGHTISNLYTNSSSNAGLFKKLASGFEIKNLRLTNVDVCSPGKGGSLCSDVKSGAKITNCSVDGGKFTRRNNGSYHGGIAGSSNGTISYCYVNLNMNVYGHASGLIVGSGNANYCLTKGNITGNEVGGICGGGGATNCASSATINGDISGGIVSCYAGDIIGCYFLGSVKGASSAGGIVGTARSRIEVADCYVAGSLEGKEGSIYIIGTLPDYSVVNNCYYDSSKTKEITAFCSGSKRNDNVIDTFAYSDWSFQVGTNSDSSSSLNYTMHMGNLGLWNILSFGLDSPNSLSIIDNFLNIIENEQTKIGAIENRLMSVLDEINLQYENLVSSRSTIQDADITEVSSEYIRQQILQQASATLMATANQSPSLALQLL